MIAPFPVPTTRSLPFESSIFPPANSKEAFERVKVTLPAPSVKSIVFPEAAVYTAAPCL